MRRLLAAVIVGLLPLSAAAQSLAGDTHALAQRLLAQPPAQLAEVSPGVSVPLWLGADGHLLTLRADNRTPGQALDQDAPLSFSVVDARSALSSGASYVLAPSLQAHAQVSSHSFVGSTVQVIGSELGATYSAGRYSVGLSLGSDTTNRPVQLPRVLPGVVPGSGAFGLNGGVVNGLTGFDSSTQVNARGRLALDAASGVDMGASVGRIHLLPGNLLGVDTLDQKAISFGVDSGPLSGSIVGRVMEPSAGAAYSPDRRWSSVDLGVTWRLPWQGRLSVGAQNLWSSGAPANSPAGPEPDQSRTPYVQYHQDL